MYVYMMWIPLFRHRYQHKKPYTILVTMKEVGVYLIYNNFICELLYMMQTSCMNRFVF